MPCGTNASPATPPEKSACARAASAQGSAGGCTPSAGRMVALLACAACTPAVAADTWTFEAFGGNAYNFNSRLKITQERGFSQSLTANYETRGFRSPPYYLLRAARWQNQRAWEISLIHHKLYLTNPPAGVSRQSVSHGV